jgi:rSAM/selenodomain-associated transferase 1
LIIFVKNAIPGKVKTRLAKTMGEQKAMEVYQQLLKYTHKATHKLPMDKAVYYSDSIETGDIWDTGITKSLCRKEAILVNACSMHLKPASARTIKKLSSFGSDCPEISPKIITEAFDALPQNNFVIGPTHDGGYYLLGMASLYAILFKNKRWSSDEVLHDTLVDIRNMNGSYKLLKELTDIDREDDLMQVDFQFT